MTDTTTDAAIENEAAQRQINPEVLQNISVTLSIEVGRAMIKKLYVYAGSEHPHTAQKPEAINFK